MRGVGSGLLVPSNMAMDVWRVSDRCTLDLSVPRVVAILNVTPDSFADGGRLGSPEAVADSAERAVRDGAAMLDVGGESTRPGAVRVSASDQISRVVPAIRAIRARLPLVLISVDTTLAEVAHAALDAGADAINDVSAGEEDAAMLALAAKRRAGIILMHRLKPPGSDSYSDRYAKAPAYDSTLGVVGEVRSYLAKRNGAATSAGVAPDAIVLDPGLGFGKSVEQNVELIRGTPLLRTLGRPILSALSRKSFVGRVGLGRDSEPGERLAPTLSLSVQHFGFGASLFRVHDVREHVEALAAAQAVGSPPSA